MYLAGSPVALVLTASLLSQAVAFRQPYEYLKALELFQNGFLNPSDVVLMKRPSVLADDIVGRIDVTTTFVGNQLNTEYLYGLWIDISLETNSTSLIGSPINQTIQSLVIEPPMVFVSTVTNLNYSTINTILPIQIDMIFRFNNDLMIESYDVTFRRWPEAFKYLIPKLAPQIAKELNQTYDAETTNVTSLLALRAATDICEVADQYCVGNNTQYGSYDQCMVFLTASVPFGDMWEGGLDTTWCRWIHKNMVKYRPDVHCPHIGPSGGDMCIARNYIDIVETFPFRSTLVAANASYSASDMNGLSEESIDQLLGISTQVVVPTTIAFFSVSTMLLFVFLYLAAKVVEAILSLMSTEYPKLSFENKRNTVTYILNTLMTTIALGFQLVATPAFARVYTFRGEAGMTVTANIISALYIFEMCYRSSMRFSLLAHHFCTLIAILTIIISLEITAHPATITLGFVWLFQATTEQSIFVGLFLYRLRYSRRLTRGVLCYAAVQSFIIKLMSAIYLVVWWALRLARLHAPMDISVSVVVCLNGILLLVTQGYGSWAVWSLASNMIPKSRPPPCHDESEVGNLTPRSGIASAATSESH